MVKEVQPKEIPTQHVLFCALETDAAGVKAIEILQGLGCDTQLLPQGESPPADAVVFFTHPDGTYPNNNLRQAAHQIEHVPDWLKSSPFIVAIKPNSPLDGMDFTKAVTSAARDHERYRSGKWPQPWHDGDGEMTSESLHALGDWQRKATNALPSLDGWESTPSLHHKKKRVKDKGKGWEVTQRLPRHSETISLSPHQRLKESSLVAAVGAFNWGVGMSLDDTRLHRVYQETLKRLALVAEQAQSGAGELLFRSLPTVAVEQIFTDMVIDALGLGEQGLTPTTHEFLELSQEELLVRLREAMEYVAPDMLSDLKSQLLARFQSGESITMSFYPKVEAILVYGRDWENLSTQEKATARLYRLADEFKHFSRIMDPDLIIEVKRVVGTADAGNPRMLRLVEYSADYRKRLDLYQPWPMPNTVIVEEARYTDPLAPTFVRKNAPYIGAVVSASEKGLARNMIDIFRRLVSQHSLESSMALVEEWLMLGDPDPDVSVSAFQIHNDGNRLWLKVAGIGDGAVVIRGSRNEIIHFPKTGQQYGDLAVGRVDYQHPLHQQVIQIEPGDIIEALPATFPGLDELTLSSIGEEPLATSGTARMKVNHLAQLRVEVFEWTPEHVNHQLAGLVEQITSLQPQFVHVQVGHIHSDRDFGPEQETGAFMTRSFVDLLEANGITNIMVEPMIDNLHVIDRVDVDRYLEQLSHFYGRPITNVAYEASLLTRRLGDQLIVKIAQQHPELIERVGHNVYLRVDDNIYVELYDGVGENMEHRGRQGCVPWNAGYEIRRLNPVLASQIWQDIVSELYPQSVVAQWWAEEPHLDFEALTHKRIYQLNPERRAALKAQLDREIDIPYAQKVQSGDTSFLDAILSTVDPSRVALVHFLEGAYNAQHTKASHFLRLAGALPLNLWRVSFDRHTGRVVVLDINNP